MACTIEIDVKGNVDYCWIGRTDKHIAKTSQLYVVGKDNTIQISEPTLVNTANETFKITLYTYDKDKGFFKNNGTFLFRVCVPDKTKSNIGYTLETKSVCLLPPVQKNDRWDNGIETDVFPVSITVCLPYFVQDVYQEYKSLSKQIQKSSESLERTLYSTTAIPNCNNCEWFVRQSQNEYEWPFCMPGCTGIRQAGYGIPSLCMVNALVDHACFLCGFSYKMFTTLDPASTQYNNVLHAISCIAMGAAGYSNGYSTEVSMLLYYTHSVLSIHSTSYQQEIDDTSNVWVAMGSNKDCEDFATACVSTINAICRYPRFSSNKTTSNPMTALVIDYIQNNFTTAFVTAGWVQVNIQNYTGGGEITENEGHAWCSVKMKDETFSIIECTTPILPHKYPRTLKNQTLEQHIFTLYGATFNLTAKTIMATDIGYGPAQLQPRERYKAVAFLYSDTNGYAVCKSDKKVGVPADNFIKGEATLISLSTPEEQTLIQAFRDLDINPDFNEISDIILNDINLHDRSVKHLSLDLDITTLPIMPSSSIKFVPANQLVSSGSNIVGELNFKTDGTTPICIFPAIISPTAQGFYIGLLRESSIVFIDNSK